MSLIVCFSSRDFAGICEPIEVLVALQNITVVSLPRTFRKQIGKSGEMCRCNGISKWKFGQ